VVINKWQSINGIRKIIAFKVKMKFNTQPLSLHAASKASASTKAARKSPSIELLILPVAGKTLLGETAIWADQQTQGLLTSLLSSGDLNDKAGSLMVQRFSVGKAKGPDTAQNTGQGSTPAFERIMLVSLGKDAKALKEKDFLDASLAAAKAALALPNSAAVSALQEARVLARDDSWKLRQSILKWREASYRFDAMKSTSSPKPKLAEVQFTGAGDLQNFGGILKSSVALANGIDLAKDLGNLPPNVCTPSYLAGRARKLSTEFKLKCEVLGEKQMQALKMGSFLSVAKGSALPPQFIVVHYNGGPAKQAPVVLVGKGITFDTGGISLKPAPEMDEMKYDMCGAASVLGTLQAIAQMKLKLNVIGVIPTCENMPGGRAVKPGDIVTSMSGQTIEILNTDAEGRLILCDALTYTERFKPAAVIDIATLTGACVIALGHHHSGLFTANEALSSALVAAGKTSGDTCWPMPVDETYGEALKSNFADVANVGGRAGGSITAACFLARFTGKYDWAHLDIAGTAWKSGAAKGSTGRPVSLLTEFLEQRVA
jgi:leucyl aminopeptidase